MCWCISHYYLFAVTRCLCRLVYVSKHGGLLSRGATHLTHHIATITEGAWDRRTKLKHGVTCKGWRPRTKNKAFYWRREGHCQTQFPNYLYNSRLWNGILYNYRYPAWWGTAIRLSSSGWYSRIIVSSSSMLWSLRKCGVNETLKTTPLCGPLMQGLRYTTSSKSLFRCKLRLELASTHQVKNSPKSKKKSPFVSTSLIVLSME